MCMNTKMIYIVPLAGAIGVLYWSDAVEIYYGLGSYYHDEHVVQYSQVTQSPMPDIPITGAR